MKTHVATCVAIELSGGVRKNDGKFIVVVHVGAAGAGKTEKRSVNGSLVHWNELNITM
jgi:hypothetical protein